MGINYADIAVTIPFVRVDADQNPNLNARRQVDPATPYFQAMVVAFASVRRIHPTVKLKLVTNAMPPTMFLEDLLSLEVDIDQVPFRHRPPEGFAKRFEASFYMLDALANADADTTIFIDPDVLCLTSMDEMLHSVGRHVGALPIDYNPDHDINGLSRREAGQLHALLGDPQENPTHYGGEVLIFPREQISQTLERCERAWHMSLAQHSNGSAKFTTEEHIFSYALRGVHVQEVGSYVRRVWTARTHRTVTGTERNLALWHLPAEKGRGFTSAYQALKSNGWSSNHINFMNWAGREMGVYNRSLTRIGIDTVGQVVGHARKIADTVKRSKRDANT